MTRKFLSMTAAAALLAGAMPLMAQEEGDVLPSADRNSPFCGFTYYGNGPDNLDFRGGPEQRCFDMKGGDDILILNRTEFPSGVRVYTGTGRDTVWTTNANDYVHDTDGMDREIRTYDGNDVIVIETKFDRDPNRNISVSERTIVKPGAGRNEIRFGREVKNNAMSRSSPDIWLTTDPLAEDSVEATCGHPTISADYDIRSLIIPENSSVSYDTDGCHLGIFGLYGDADVNMLGGRLALQTYSEGFRIPDGENLPTITGEVEGGMSLMLDIDKSSPDSDFTWEGPGSVFIRSRIADAKSGGSFHIRSGREVHYQGDVSAGDLRFGLAARGVVKLDLVARGRSGDNIFELAASRIDVSWRLAGEGGFPTIINDKAVVYQETDFIIPDLDWEGAIQKDRGNLAIEPDHLVNNMLPQNLSDIQKTSEEVQIDPGQTRLRLQLRRDNDRFGKCVSLRVVDTDGTEPDIKKACASVSGPLQSVVVENAQEYEQIFITGNGVDLEIPINNASRFKVNRLEIDL